MFSEPNPIQQFYLKIQPKLKMIRMHQKQCQSGNLTYQTEKNNSKHHAVIDLSWA